MIDVRLVRQDPDAARASLGRRRDPGALDALEQAIELDQRWRMAVTALEQVQAQRNRQTQQVAERRRTGQAADELLAQLKTSAAEEHQRQADAQHLATALETVLLSIPNFLLSTVPEGGAADNRVERQWGTPREFEFAPKPHWELGQTLGLFDLPRGARIAGSGFPLFTGMGARLVRGLTNFLLDLQTVQHGYTEVQPPYLVNREALTGTGQLPKFADDLYHTDPDDLFLIPTGEVPLTNICRDEILSADELPKAWVACTPCFRREAGAHGKDTRGLIRVHQFDKVELVRIVHPDASADEHALLTRHAEAALQQLNLPYRVLALAAGDTGFHSAQTLDLEVWAPGVGTWLEVSSASAFTDFQARRANIRFRRAPGAKPEFVHTLNASGVAFPRTIIALLEQGQQADGSVILPEALVPYVGTDRLAAPA